MKIPLVAPFAFLLSASLALTSCDKQDDTVTAATPATQAGASALVGAGEQSSWSNAKSWTAAYQAAHPAGVRSSYYAAAVFKSLLSQPAVTGICIYNATNKNGDCLVLVGATQSQDLTGGQYRLYDKGHTCPKACVTSELNHGASSLSTVSTTTGEVITFAQADAWIKAYQFAHPAGMKSSFYSADVFNSLLSQPTATGIQIYKPPKRMATVTC